MGPFARLLVQLRVGLKLERQFVRSRADFDFKVGRFNAAVFGMNQGLRGEFWMKHGLFVGAGVGLGHAGDHHLVAARPSPIAGGEGAQPEAAVGLNLSARPSLAAVDRFAAACAGGGLQLRDSRRGNAKTFASDDCLHAVAADRMGRVLANSREAGVITIWDATGKLRGRFDPAARQ